MRPELESMLLKVVDNHMERSRRLASDWGPKEPPAWNKIISGALGHDLEWLDKLALGRIESPTKEEFEAKKHHVIRDIYLPPVMEEPTDSDAFADTPLGEVIEEAEARLGGARTDGPRATGSRNLES